MGFYPDCPGDPSYTLTLPRFDKIEITLDPDLCGGNSLLTIVMEQSSLSLGQSSQGKITSIELGGRKLPSFRVSHSDLVRGGTLKLVN